jgi:hypothetical protein
MPSIELVSVGQLDAPRLPPFAFAVRSSPQLVSDRSPSPLFQGDFDELKGWIYHLGSPFCSKPDYRGPFFAYELLSRRSLLGDLNGLLEFAPNFVLDLRPLLGLLLQLSPLRQVVFTTDWQFGPTPPERSQPVSPGQFWRLHAGRHLRLNSLYPIHDSV